MRRGWTRKPGHPANQVDRRPHLLEMGVMVEEEKPTVGMKAKAPSYDTKYPGLGIITNS